jgi:hypothetical protein
MAPPSIAVGQIIEEQSLGAFMNANGLTNGSLLDCCGERLPLSTSSSLAHAKVGTTFGTTTGEGEWCATISGFSASEGRQTQEKYSALDADVPKNSRYVAPKGKQLLLWKGKGAR